MSAAPGPDGASCATCRYWGGRPTGLTRDRGRAFPCRRHAPLPARGGQKGAEMPYTPHDFWCGEHRPDTTETSR